VRAVPLLAFHSSLWFQVEAGDALPLFTRLMAAAPPPAALASLLRQLPFGAALGGLPAEDDAVRAAVLQPIEAVLQRRGPCEAALYSECVPLPLRGHTQGGRWPYVSGMGCGRRCPSLRLASLTVAVILPRPTTKNKNDK
jgi:hypothetical protein